MSRINNDETKMRNTLNVTVGSRPVREHHRPT